MKTENSNKSNFICIFSYMSEKMKLWLAVVWSGMFLHRPCCSFKLINQLHHQALIPRLTNIDSLSSRHQPYRIWRILRKRLSIKCREVHASAASVVYDERHVNHDDRSHPEKSSRATVMWHALESSGLASRSQQLLGREATRDELTLAHTEAYIDAVNNCDAEMDESTYFTSGTPLAARIAAGSVLEMTKQVCLFLYRRRFILIF